MEKMKVRVLSVNGRPVSKGKDIREIPVEDGYINVGGRYGKVPEDKFGAVCAVLGIEIEILEEAN